MEGTGWRMGLPPSVGCVGGDRVIGGVDLHLSPPEHRGAIYIATRPIMELCLSGKQRTGPRVAMLWWEQEDMDLEEMWTAFQEAERMEGEEEDLDGTETVTDY